MSSYIYTVEYTATAHRTTPVMLTVKDTETDKIVSKMTLGHLPFATFITLFGSVTHPKPGTFSTTISPKQARVLINRQLMPTRHTPARTPAHTPAHVPEKVDEPTNQIQPKNIIVDALDIIFNFKGGD